MSVIELGAHDRMTPEQVLALCVREQWEKVIICGYHKDDNTLVVRSSHMTRETAFWIAEHLKLHALDSL